MAPTVPPAKEKMAGPNKGNIVIAMIEQANAACLSAFSQQLTEIEAVFCENSSVFTRVERLCPEFEMRKYNIENEVIYVSNGCHLLSEKSSLNRYEFVIGNFINKNIFVEILN